MHRIVGAEGTLEFFESVLDGMVDMVRVIDAQCNVVLANERMRTVLGSVEGSKCYASLSAGGAACANCVGGKARAAQRVFEKKVELNQRQYSVIASPLTRPDGEPWCVEVWRDMTREYAISDELRRRDQKTKRDLAYARRLQWNMLPRHMPSQQGYRFAAQYKPCEELSGDFFDAFRLDSDHVAFYIADVAGHGVPASLLTVFFARLIRAEMEEADSPAQVLGAATSRFAEMGFEEQMYITAVVARLQLSTGQVTWCNAGHAVPPLYFSRDGIKLLEMPGIPVCRWNMDFPRRDASFILDEGEKLLFYTDGLESVWNAHHREPLCQGLERMIHAPLCENIPQEIWREASRGVPRESSAPHNDDTAILLVCREGAQR
ncbi:MAG: SpoIIE family protein phosphatase [Eubacteriales bacterium]|nr:SpoIIE family protein phosphatase [Eubacteriales bacterium]